MCYQPVNALKTGGRARLVRQSVAHEWPRVADTVESSPLGFLFLRTRRRGVRGVRALSPFFVGLPATFQTREKYRHVAPGEPCF